MSDFNSRLPVQNDGVYDVVDNKLPATVGAIGHVRGATPDATSLSIRVTGAKPNSDSVDEETIHALDVNAFMMGWDSANSEWDRVQITGGSFNVNVTNLNVDGVYDAGTNANPDNIGIIVHDRAASPGDVDQKFRPTGAKPDADNISAANVYAIDTNSFLYGWDATGSNWDRVGLSGGTLNVSLHDEDGNAYSITNPLHVTIVESDGDEINDFFENVNVAALGSGNHDYTVSGGKTLYLTQIECSGSGKFKAEVLIETGVATGIYTTKWVQFNSSSDPNTSLVLKEPIAVAAGVKVRVTVTNRDHQPQSIYSTISGHEI